MKKFFKILLFIIMCSLFAFSAFGCGGVNTVDVEVPTPRQMKTDGPRITSGSVVFPSSLWQTPNATRAPEFDVGNSKGYFIENVNDTAFFAYVGIPESDSNGKTVNANNKVPGIVLVHGGGGTAFYQWVDFWTARGYAAIAMCTDANVPTISGDNKTYINNANHTDVSQYTVGSTTFNIGPDNPGGFADYYKPVTQQWAYHAIGSVIASNSYLRSLDCVDGDKIALTGISYGSFLTCQAASHDDRFACAVPIYGSFYNRVGDSRFSGYFNGYPQKEELWDNDGVMVGNNTPFFFVNSSNDTAFSVVATTISDKTMATSKMLIEYGLLHGHDIGAFEISEVHTYIDSVCLGKRRLINIIEQPDIDSGRMKVSLPAGITIDTVELFYTTADKLTNSTIWKLTGCDFNGDEIVVDVPITAKYFFVNVIDSDLNTVSSHVIDLSN